MTTEILTLAIVAGSMQVANQIIGLVKLLVEFHIDQKKKKDSDRSERSKSRRIRN